MVFQPYTSESLSVAYQLRWSLSIFPHCPIEQNIDWLPELSGACEPDGIRVLEARFTNSGAILLLLSTQPHVPPPVIVQRVKGRLQYVLRPRLNLRWKRNFQLKAVGDSNSQSVDEYLTSQLMHHQMASEVSQRNLELAAWQDPVSDITRPVYSSHGQYILGMHAVLVHADRWRIADRSFAELTRESIRSSLLHNDCVPSRIAILADHSHFTFKLDYRLSPQDAMLAVMNDVSSAHGMRLWMNGYYIGTVGVYDMAAIRRQLNK